MTQVVDEKQAAKIIGLSPYFLRNARCQGTDSPKFLKLGKAVRYRVSDLEAWLKSKERETATGTN
jgi:predicted DNA-binding transcriptional regulator AlpA